MSDAAALMESDEPIAVIRTHADLLDALRTAKAMRGLSNDFCDDRGGLTRGHTDKALGPSQVKTLSPMLLETFLTLFAVKLVLVPDPEAEAEMRPRWEGRLQSNVRVEPNRVSQKLIERARPHVMRDLAPEAERLHADLGALMARYLRMFDPIALVPAPPTPEQIENLRASCEPIEQHRQQIALEHAGLGKKAQ